MAELEALFVERFKELESKEQAQSQIIKNLSRELDKYLEEGKKLYRCLDVVRYLFAIDVIQFIDDRKTKVSINYRSLEEFDKLAEDLLLIKEQLVDVSLEEANRIEKLWSMGDFNYEELGEEND